MIAIVFLVALNIDNQYNSTTEEEYRESYFPYPIWKEPAMHQLLVDVALGGAKAFVLSHRPARMSHNVLLRIDIALTQHAGMVGFCSWFYCLQLLLFAQKTTSSNSHLVSRCCAMPFAMQDQSEVCAPHTAKLLLKNCTLLNQSHKRSTVLDLQALNTALFLVSLEYFKCRSGLSSMKRITMLMPPSCSLFGPLSPKQLTRIGMSKQPSMHSSTHLVASQKKFLVGVFGWQNIYGKRQICASAKLSNTWMRDVSAMARIRNKEIFEETGRLQQLTRGWFARWDLVGDLVCVLNCV